MDAVIAAVDRKLGAPVVSADCYLAHEAPKRVTDVETYQSVTIRHDISNIQRVFITQGGGIPDSVWKHHAVEKLY